MTFRNLFTESENENLIPVYSVVRQNTGTNEQPASQVYSVKVATPEGADPHPFPFLYAR